MNRYFLHLGYCAKLGIAFILLHVFYRDLLGKKLWLIYEKRGRTEARDNGYWFFRHLRLNHPEQECFFVIDSSSPDYEKVRLLGKTVKPDSINHCIVYLAARYDVSSQGGGSYPFDLSFRFVGFLHRTIKRNSVCVFLQHGIMQNAVGVPYEFDKGLIDVFVTSNIREKEFIQDTCFFPPERVILVGLCRFDHLEDMSGDRLDVLVMPTHRSWLNCSNLNHPPTKIEIERFLQSDFFRRYTSLLCCLSENERINGDISFYLHHALQPFSDLFRESVPDRIRILKSSEVDIQDLLKRNSLLITDYSSVHFDFAFMGKPVIYYQFDREDFHSAHYSPGYFDYENDAFGPVVTREKDLLDLVSNKEGALFRFEEDYAARARLFFSSCSNGDNCERTFRKILELESTVIASKRGEA